MGTFLVLLLIPILVALFFVLSVIVWIAAKLGILKRMFVSGNQGTTHHSSGNGTNTGSNAYSSTSSTSSSSRQHGKIIPDGEGEYVDFEEV